MVFNVSFNLKPLGINIYIANLHLFLSSVPARRGQNSATKELFSQVRSAQSQVTDTSHSREFSLYVKSIFSDKVMLIMSIKERCFILPTFNLIRVEAVAALDSDDTARLSFAELARASYLSLT